MFGMQKSHLSSAILTFAQTFFLLSIKYLLDPRIWHTQMPCCAHLISNYINGLMGNTYLLPTPLLHKVQKCHAIKFQSIVTPDGMIAYLYGPVVRKRHDARTLTESGRIKVLQQLMPVDASNGPVFSLYGDLAYPQSMWLFGGFFNPVQDSLEAQYNRQMSRARIAVEWGFPLALLSFPFVRRVMNSIMCCCIWFCCCIKIFA